MPSRAPAAGALAVLAALGASELAAGLFPQVPSLVEAVADVVIDAVPAPVKDWAIATFGTADKAALVVGIVLTVAVVGAGIGVLARRSFRLAAATLVGVGLLGVAAALVAGEPGGGAAGGGTVAAVAGVLALHWLAGRVGDASGAGTVGTGGGDDAERVAAERAGTERAATGRAGADRRSFLVAAGVVAGLAALSTATGRALLEQAKRVVSGRESVVLPLPSERVPAPAAATSFAEPGLGPLLTPNDEFFRIDTALSVPRVDLDAWRLRVHGLVDRPFEIGFEELLDMDLVERHITIACVSNEVGGDLVGTAVWLGVPLAVLLDRAGVRPGADQIVGRSVDGFTVGFPTAAALDGREALVAVAMNGEPLPFEHGFPARLVVAGLYGYVSATKWLAEIELTTWDAFDAYWVPRGWSKEAPVKTQSRIDTPRGGATMGTAARAIAGVAWAPNVGIGRVEVQVDDGAWAEAELADALDEDTWRQWRLPWTPTPGGHVIRVRATDSTGATQTPDVARPAPNGASGWHTIRVTVTE